MSVVTAGQWHLIAIEGFISHADTKVSDFFRGSSETDQMIAAQCETQSKVSKNNTGHSQTGFDGAVNSLFLQIIPSVVKTVSARRHKQTHNSVALSVNIVFFFSIDKLDPP